MFLALSPKTDLCRIAISREDGVLGRLVTNFGFIEQARGARCLYAMELGGQEWL